MNVSKTRLQSKWNAPFFFFFFERDAPKALRAGGFCSEGVLPSPLSGTRRTKQTGTIHTHHVITSNQITSNQFSTKIRQTTKTAQSKKTAKHATPSKSNSIIFCQRKSAQRPNLWHKQNGRRQRPLLVPSATVPRQN